MTPQEKGNAIISVLTGGGNPSPIESNNGIKTITHWITLWATHLKVIYKNRAARRFRCVFETKGVSNYGF